MRIISMEGTEISPQLYANPEKKIIELSGRVLLYADEIMMLSNNLFTWLEEYVNTYHELTFKFKLDYINTFFTKHLLFIFRILESHQAYKNCKIAIHWYYHSDDDDLKQLGRELEELTCLSFSHFPNQKPEG